MLYRELPDEDPHNQDDSRYIQDEFENYRREAIDSAVRLRDARVRIASNRESLAKDQIASLDDLFREFETTHQPVLNGLAEYSMTQIAERIWQIVNATRVAKDLETKISEALRNIVG